MILTGHEIHQNVLKNKIVIEPFNHGQLNPNSYNFRLGKTIKVYKDYVLDTKINHKTKTVSIPPDGLILHPQFLYLGHTEEIMGSKHYVPIIRGRSSTGRLGLFINITADLIDIGSINQWTLQMHAIQPVKVYAGMLIGQVTFWEVQGEIELYKGKYQGSMGPIKSHIYKEM